MAKINDWIDRTPAMHYFMFVGSIILGIMIFQTKQNFLAIAFCVGASLVFFPPMQKNFKKLLGHDIERRYFMNMGIIMLIIAIFAQVGQ